MKGKTTIRTSQAGWVVYFGNDVENFVVFRSDEPERFVKFICERVGGIKVDQLLATRKAEIEQAAKQFDSSK